jgi:hypothetical protein
VGALRDLDFGQLEIDPRRIREPIHGGGQPLAAKRQSIILHCPDNKVRYDRPAEAQSYASDRNNGREPLI